MTIELTPEIKRALERESARSGETLAAIAMRVLEQFARTDARRAEQPEPNFTAEVRIVDSGDVSKQRREAYEHIVARRDAAQGNFGPPPGMRWRDWIHEDHKY